MAQRFEKPPLRILGVAFNTYIIMEYGDLLILSDQHAVHERLLYEQFMRETAAAPASQALLIPLIVTLSRAEYACLEENQEALRKAGFDLTPSARTRRNCGAFPSCWASPRRKPACGRPWTS